MCGIAALFAYHSDAPAVRSDELLAINNAMLRRGPDGGDHWVDNASRIGLAHRRLAIIDLSADAAQPMVIDALDGAKARYHITYNGEIYNFRALRSELESAGVNFTTQSDTEVLLRLYERFGAAMVERLRGMFALAIWDARAETLFLARDAFGIKPLYLADDGRTLRVASQVKALLAGGHAGQVGPDPAGHTGFFLFGSVPDPHTLYADIKALPAGTTLSINKGGARQETHFFDVRQSLIEASKGENDDLRELLLDSVRHHFVADVPVGLFLSAGLDSTTLTGLAAESQAGDIRTFTLGFEEFKNTPKDEVPLAEAVAAHYGTTHLTERIARRHFDDALPDILHAMDQPSVDGVNSYFVARVAANGGLKVALSGLGGDELFGGYDTFTQVPRLAGTLGAVPGIGCLGKAVRVVAGPLIARMMSPKYAGLLELGGTYGGAYLLRRGLFMPWELPHLMDPDMAREGWQTLQPMIRLNAEAAGIAAPQNKIRALEMAWYMRNQLLRDADWAGMAHSLEIRVPLVDPVLFSALASSLGGATSPTKRDMALTPAKPLPDAVLNRLKTGFFVPVERWAQEGAHGLRGWAGKVHAAQIG
ncbi:MAG: asparagine synthase (glutamine-hydrolyzing) [Rhodospirillaceae bacterium]|jgi:asparagine synthase (glutamine-hydrolysing)|nr:asparagine synthase (glutamine-hydrolyzing) [Rhodospirillaceae bacterium]